MALKPCKECGAEISTAAAACPKCGAPVPSVANQVSTMGARLWLGIKLLVGAFVALVVFQCTSRMASVSDAGKTATATQVAATPASPRCGPGDFAMSGIKTRREYDFIVFTGTVRNTSTVACGVQLKASTYDKAGTVVDTQEFWPASIRNIAPGASENFTYMLRYENTVHKYEVETIDAKVWAAVR